MKQRTAILLALGLTVFVLVVTGAIMMSIQSKNPTQLANSQETQLDVKGVGVKVGLGPILEPTQLPSPTRAVSGEKVAAAASALLSAERAKRAALIFVPGSTSKQEPELVNYKGKMAYEVVLDIAIVYVDAFSGKVLGSVSTIVRETPPADTGGSYDDGGGDQGGGDSSYESPSASSNEPTNNQPPPADTPQDPSGPPQDDGGNDDHGGDDHSGDTHSDNGNDDHGDEDTHSDEDQSGGGDHSNEDKHGDEDHGSEKGHHKGQKHYSESQEQGDEAETN